MNKRTVITPLYFDLVAVVATIVESVEVLVVLAGAATVGIAIATGVDKSLELVALVAVTAIVPKEQCSVAQS